MKPVIAIVGRPNVGKSTLFNRLTQSRSAIVADIAGLTRDRQYGEGRMGDKPYIVIDTGGIGEEIETIDNLMSGQSWQAVQEADHVLFVIDGRAGITPSDEQIAKRLRQTDKIVTLVVNKIDGANFDVALAESSRLGFPNVEFISASHGRGVENLVGEFLALFPDPEINQDDIPSNAIRLAMIGRPNVGKSTLLNRFLGEERVIVSDVPGTTRDSIEVPFERRGKLYHLIDTAGIRRRGKVTETIEKFSVVKTLQAIDKAQVAIMLIDATEGVTDQDCHLLSFILDAGTALVLAVNKWDGLSGSDKDEVKRGLEHKLQFVNFARMHFISALHGTGVGNLFKSVNEAYGCASKKLSTPILTRMLEAAVTAHSPPLVKGRRIKLRFAHSGGHHPPIIVIHGNQTESIPDSYRRYLNNYFREKLRLVGTPIQIEFKSSQNPYEGRKNPLTVSQERKRRRLISHVKRKSK